MTLLPFAADRLRPALTLATFALAITTLAPSAPAQNPAAPNPSADKSAERPSVPEIEETFTINNATAQRDLNDVQTALRSMLPRANIYGVESQDAIAIRATPEELESAKKMIAELDRPRKAYRVTYTLTDIDNGRPVGTQHVAIIVISGSSTRLKQGNRVPLVTGMQEGPTSNQNAQVQYIDVGLNIEANIDGGRLRSKIEQSGVSEEKSGFGAQDPVVHQTMLEGFSNLENGKPAVIGSLDIPGTTRHQEIEVTAEPLT
jgi:type II secretory pathway component GspD/PulD (secretin)